MQNWPNSSTYLQVATFLTCVSGRLPSIPLPIWGAFQNVADAGTLKISDVYTPERALKNLLKSHATTLRSMVLRSIRIIRCEGQENPTSWIPNLQFLQSSLTLDHVGVEETLTNAWREESYSLSKMKKDHGVRLKEPKPFSQNCLRHRVELYITEGGPCPLRDSDKTCPHSRHYQTFYFSALRVIQF